MSRPETTTATCHKQQQGRPRDLAVPLLGMYPDKPIIQKDTHTPMFTAALCTVAKTWQQPKCPWTDEWIQEVWYMYTMGYFWL